MEQVPGKPGDLRQKEAGPATPIASTGPAVAQVGGQMEQVPGKPGDLRQKEAGPATPIASTGPAVVQVAGEISASGGA